MLIIAETPRLLIRSWLPQDLDPYGALLGEKVNNSPYHAQVPSCQAENELWRYRAEMDKWGWSRWAVVAKGDYRLIGYCGFSPYGDAVEMSWRFLPEYRGKGLVLEAVKAVSQHGFEELGFQRIISFTKPGNSSMALN